MRYEIRVISDARRTLCAAETLATAATEAAATELAAEHAADHVYGVAVIDRATSTIDWGGGDLSTLVEDSVGPLRGDDLPRPRQLSDGQLLLEIGRRIERLLAEAAERPGIRTEDLLREAMRRGMAELQLPPADGGGRAWRVFDGSRLIGTLYECPCKWYTEETRCECYCSCRSAATTTVEGLQVCTICAAYLQAYPPLARDLAEKGERKKK